MVILVQMNIIRNCYLNCSYIASCKAKSWPSDMYCMSLFVGFIMLDAIQNPF